MTTVISMPRPKVVDDGQPRPCSKCGVTKPASEFYVQKRIGYERRVRHCKDCHRIMLKKRTRKFLDAGLTTNGTARKDNGKGAAGYDADPVGKRIIAAVNPHCWLCGNRIYEVKGSFVGGHKKDCKWHPRNYRPRFKIGREAASEKEIPPKLRYDAMCDNGHQFITNMAAPTCPFCQSKNCTSELIPPSTT